MSEPFPTAARAATLHDGFALLGAGRAADASQLARLQLAAQPHHVGWTTLLALALSSDGCPAEALALFEGLCRSAPQDAAHWSNLGTCLCDLGREREALAPLQHALTLGGDDAAVHAGLARAYLRTGPARLALVHVERALAHDRATDLHLLRVRALLAADELQAARDALTLLNHTSLPHAQRIEGAFASLQAGLPAQAERWFASVLQHAPADADALLGHVLSLERLNRLEDAEAQLAKLRQAAPTDVALLQADARLSLRRRDYPMAINALERLLDRSDLRPDERVTLQFQHADALTRSGARDAGMRVYDTAHAAAKQVAESQHPELAHQDLYAALSESCASGHPPWPELADEGARDPVFVVGFPRSGTTLLEQLLDAHPALASFDEQPFVQAIAQALYAQADDAAQGLRQWSREDARRARNGYFAAVQGVTGALGQLRAVDKNPLNLIRLDLLAQLFPAARGVLVLRHPCDAVLSCYMQHFSAPSFAFAFESLERTAVLYDRVFGRWLRMSQGLVMPVLPVRYEDLVADTETQARRLIEFLGLPWSDDALKFTEHAQRRAIGTPSYAQVVQPVYRSAVGRWRDYRRHFNARTLQLLAPWAERFGYAMD